MKAGARSDMSDDCGKQICSTWELLVLNMVSQVCRGNSPGPVIISDQTWKGVEGVSEWDVLKRLV